MAENDRAVLEQPEIPASRYYLRSRGQSQLSDMVFEWEKLYLLPNHSYSILIAEIRNRMEQQGMNQKQAAEVLGIDYAKKILCD